MATIKHQRNTVPGILKLVFLEIPNVQFGTVFQNSVTYHITILNLKLSRHSSIPRVK